MVDTWGRIRKSIGSSISENVIVNDKAGIKVVALIFSSNFLAIDRPYVSN